MYIYIYMYTHTQMRVSWNRKSPSHHGFQYQKWSDQLADRHGLWKTTLIGLCITYPDIFCIYIYMYRYTHQHIYIYDMCFHWISYVIYISHFIYVSYSMCVYIYIHMCNMYIYFTCVSSFIYVFYYICLVISYCLFIFYLIYTTSTVLYIYIHLWWELIYVYSVQ